MSILHSVSKCVAAAVSDERLADTAECPGSYHHDDHDHKYYDDNHDDIIMITMVIKMMIMQMTVSVDHLREEEDHIGDCPDYPLGARDERVKLKKRFLGEIQDNLGFGGTFSSLALMRSSWMHLVIASVLLTTSSCRS